jgi:hypothetical protein
MAKYAAVCNRFPELQVGADIKFASGTFETDDPELWRQLQANEWFGVHIHPRDLAPPEPETPAEPPTVEEAQADESEPRVRRGSRGTR